MQVCFDLIIRREDFEKVISPLEQFIEWGGEKNSQDPKRFAFGITVEFEEQKLPVHIQKRAKKLFSEFDDLVFLSFGYKSMELWECHINNSGNISDDLELKKFLTKKLTLISKWVVIFELNCEQIDNEYTLSCIQLIAKIEENLNWENTTEGFIAFSS